MVQIAAFERTIILFWGKRVNNDLSIQYEALIMFTGEISVSPISERCKISLSQLISRQFYSSCDILKIINCAMLTTVKPATY